MAASRIFITGSSDGLGSLAAKALVEQGHKVLLHARNEQRAKDAISACPGAEKVLVGDLANVEDVKALAKFTNLLNLTASFIMQIAINTIAPYLLTALVNPSKSYVYMTSGYYVQGDSGFKDTFWKDRDDKEWDDIKAYSDTKLHNVLLSNAVARHWPNTQSNAIEPGWVATRMGAPNATGDLDGCIRTYLLLANKETKATGKMFYIAKEKTTNPAASNVQTQDKFIALCEKFTGVPFPNRKTSM